MRKKPRGKAMPHWQKVRNKLISSKRFVVERTFVSMKRGYGLHRARYLGIAKVHAEVKTKVMAYNLKMAINLYQEQQQYCA